MGNVTITPHENNVPYTGGIVQLTVNSDLPGILQCAGEDNPTVKTSSMDIHEFQPGTTIVTVTIFDRSWITWISQDYPLGHSVSAQCPDTTAVHGWVTDHAIILQAALTPTPTPVPTTKTKGRRK